MKKGIIILIIALLGISFTATSALAGSSHGHGDNGTSVTVAGWGPSGYFKVHSGFSGPPVFFPFRPFFHGTGVKSRCGSRYGDYEHHRTFYNKSSRHGHHRRHENNRQRDDHGKGEKHRSNGHGKRR